MTAQSRQGEPIATRADLIGASAMTAGNAVLIVNDTLVKLAAGHLPMSQVICLRAIAAMITLLAVYRFGAGFGGRWPAPTRWLVLRALFEAGASFAYLYALQLIPIGELAGLQQIIPLALLAGAAVVFGERIGWQGWLAALVGLFGALLIIRPGFAGQVGGITAAGATLAGLAVAFQVARDLLTRALPGGFPPAYVAGTSQGAMIVGAVCLAPFDAWVRPDAVTGVQIVAAALLLALANTWLVTAMQSGRLAVVGPFRYTGLVAALIAGWVIWAEFPDASALAGGLIIAASGVAGLLIHRKGSGKEGFGKKGSGKKGSGKKGSGP